MAKRKKQHKSDTRLSQRLSATRPPTMSPPSQDFWGMVGNFGDTSFFYTVMPHWELLQKASLAGPIMKDWRLSQRIQRHLDRRRVKKEILPYLLDARHQFFNAIVVVPFLEKEGSSGTWDWPEHSGPYSMLRLQGSWKLVVVDGQHRFEALREYKDLQANDAGLADFSLGVVFLLWSAYSKHAQTREKILTAVRDVFTKLNKTAKKIDKYTQLLVDDSHMPYLCARKLLEEKSDPQTSFDEDYVKWSESTALTEEDIYLTTLSVIATAFESILQNYRRKKARIRTNGKSRREYGLTHSFDNESDRERALGLYYENHPDFAIGTADMIFEIYTSSLPFQEWKKEIAGLLKKFKLSMPKQPQQMKWPSEIRQECKRLRRANVLYTVAGQAALFQGIFGVLDDQGGVIDRQSLKGVLKGVDSLYGDKFFSRRKKIWVDILTDAKGNMLTDASRPKRYKPAARIMKAAIESKLGKAGAEDPDAVATEEKRKLGVAPRAAGPVEDDEEEAQVEIVPGDLAEESSEGDS